MLNRACRVAPGERVTETRIGGIPLTHFMHPPFSSHSNDYKCEDYSSERFYRATELEEDLVNLGLRDTGIQRLEGSIVRLGKESGYKDRILGESMLRVHGTGAHHFHTLVSRGFKRLPPPTNCRNQSGRTLVLLQCPTRIFIAGSPLLPASHWQRARWVIQG